MEFMKSKESNVYDLIITSPPYNLGTTHHTGGKRFRAYNEYDDNLPEDEYQEWQIEILNECFRLLKPNGSMFYNHKNRIKNGVSTTPYQWLLKTNFLIKQELVWFNGSQNFDKIRFYPMTERVYWLSKYPETKLNNVINHHDLFDWTPEGTDKEHKRAFPEKMISDIIRCFPNAKTVFDPFSGSGTTRVVADKLGKDFEGCEIDKDYWEAQEARYKQHISQGDLFSKEEMQKAIYQDTQLGLLDTSE
jgi:modification methylase